MKKISTLIISFLLAITLFACKNTSVMDKYKDAFHITFKNQKAFLDDKEINEYDYTWHIDPSVNHKDNDKAPAEYYTGTKPSDDELIYIDHELYYYPELDENKFKLVNYDGEKEWAYYYEDGENEDFIFSTLPCFNNTLPTYMMHSEKEALENKVLHIKTPGTYVLEGNWNGQVSVDLGDKDETFTDINASITIILNNANITCSVAPALLFNSAYECDNSWQEKDEHSYDVDTTNAGVKLVIADDSTNTIKGENIYRMLKPVFKDESKKDEVKVQKKLRKIDSPLYSYVSMNIYEEEKGSGTLNIESGFEGLGSELHLTILGGNININSNDDGINTNEDDVSVTLLKGGNITINAAKGQEGDGIDSNGYIVVDGSNLIINNIRVPDSGLDSSSGVEYISGNITINGKKIKLEPGSYMEISEDGPKKDFKHFEDGRKEFDFSININDIKEKLKDIRGDISIQELFDILAIDFIKPIENITPPSNEEPKRDDSVIPGPLKEEPKNDLFDNIQRVLDTKINITWLNNKLNELGDSVSLNDLFSIIGIDIKEPDDRPMPKK